MENIRNNENQNIISIGKIGYNTAFKENIKFQNNIYIKNKKILSRTRLKSKMNLFYTNPQPLDDNNNKCLNYLLLKSISSYNINNKSFQNNLNYIYEEKNEVYNENALEDEPEDFMHMNQNEIYLINEEKNQNEFNLKKPILKVEILNEINPFVNHKNNNYVLGAHFDDDGKKQYDDYFNFPKENDLIVSEI